MAEGAHNDMGGIKAILLAGTSAALWSPGWAIADAPAAIVPPQKMDEFRVTPKVDAEDLKSREKAPLKQMRDFLDKKGRSIGTSVRESPTQDGRRIAEVAMGETVFCIDDRRGQIDFAGIGRGGTAMRPVAGRHCQ